MARVLSSSSGFWSVAVAAVLLLLLLQAQEASAKNSYSYPISESKTARNKKRRLLRALGTTTTTTACTRPEDEPCSGKDKYSCFLKACLNGKLHNPYGSRADCIKMQYCDYKNLQSPISDAALEFKILANLAIRHLIDPHEEGFDCDNGLTKMTDPGTGVAVPLNDMLSDYDCEGLKCKCKSSAHCIRPVNNYDKTCYKEVGGVCKNTCEGATEPTCKKNYNECPACNTSEFYDTEDCPAWIPHEGEQVINGDNTLEKLGKTFGPFYVGRKDTTSCDFVACEDSSIMCGAHKKKIYSDDSLVTKSTYHGCDYLPHPHAPTPEPTVSASPSAVPSQYPSSFPSQAPSSVPSQLPSSFPSGSPTPAPTCGGKTDPILCDEGDKKIWVGRWEDCDPIKCDDPSLFEEIKYSCPGVPHIELCGDGSFVTKDPSNDCEFLKCPDGSLGSSSSSSSTSGSGSGSGSTSTDS